MLLWFAGTAFLTAWLVFRDPSFDYRLVMLGAVLPDAVDVLFGGAAIMHSVVTVVVVLAVVMVATVQRRTLRRHLIALPIGMFLHLVFDGFTTSEVFWWPFAGGSLGEHPLPVAGRGWWNLMLEVIGLAILLWGWHRFGMRDPRRRRLFLRKGRLDRALVR
jgi:hypothetical protein